MSLFAYIAISLSLCLGPNAFIWDFSLWFAFALIIWKIGRALYLPWRKCHYSDLKLQAVSSERYLDTRDKTHCFCNMPIGSSLIKHLPLTRPPAEIRDPVKITISINRSLIIPTFWVNKQVMLQEDFWVRQNEFQIIYKTPFLLILSHFEERSLVQKFWAFFLI